MDAYMKVYAAVNEAELLTLPVLLKRPVLHVEMPHGEYPWSSRPYEDKRRWFTAEPDLYFNPLVDIEWLKERRAAGTRIVISPGKFGCAWGEMEWTGRPVGGPPR